MRSKRVIILCQNIFFWTKIKKMIFFFAFTISLIWFGGQWFQPIRLQLRRIEQNYDICFFNMLRYRCLQLIWLTCVWVMWNERNHRLFWNAASPVTHLLEKVKIFSFRWLKTIDVTLASNYYTWWSNLLFCLSFD
jgi:hypothetical protein